MITQKISFSGICPFSFELYYEETRSPQGEEHFDAHTHAECEIYINLSGDVSFMVENSVYPISTGSVILTRPNEFHHCIYNSFSEPHRHFCIRFGASGNERVLRNFFDRPSGTKNLIRLGTEEAREAERICRRLLEAEDSTLLRYSDFFRLLALLEMSFSSEGGREETVLPTDVRFALDYIQEHLTSPLTVAEIAAEAHVSVNTLERHFLRSMKVTPSAFLKERRLAVAQALLRDGKSVLEACEESGFSDYSHFIALFRKRFGVTPLRYKKEGDAW